MKIGLLALVALCGAAVASAASGGSTIRTSLSDLLTEDASEDGASLAEVKVGGRRRRWHGHWPHGHWPHGHWPHGHWPHGHFPHGHWPHGHWPHGHWPHHHRPHSHRPHTHRPHSHRPHSHRPHSHKPCVPLFNELCNFPKGKYGCRRWSDSLPLTLVDGGCTSHLRAGSPKRNAYGAEENDCQTGANSCLMGSSGGAALVREKTTILNRIAEFVSYSGSDCEWSRSSRTYPWGCKDSDVSSCTKTDANCESYRKETAWYENKKGGWQAPNGGRAVLYEPCNAQAGLDFDKVLCETPIVQVNGEGGAQLVGGDTTMAKAQALLGLGNLFFHGGSCEYNAWIDTYPMDLGFGWLLDTALMGADYTKSDFNRQAVRIGFSSYFVKGSIDSLWTKLQQAPSGWRNHYESKKTEKYGAYPMYADYKTYIGILVPLLSTSCSADSQSFCQDCLGAGHSTICCTIKNHFKGALDYAIYQSTKQTTDAVHFLGATYRYNPWLCTGIIKVAVMFIRALMFQEQMIMEVDGTLSGDQKYSGIVKVLNSYHLLKTNNFDGSSPSSISCDANPHSMWHKHAGLVIREFWALAQAAKENQRVSEPTTEVAYVRALNWAIAQRMNEFFEDRKGAIRTGLPKLMKDAGMDPVQLGPSQGRPIDACYIAMDKTDIGLIEDHAAFLEQGEASTEWLTSFLENNRNDKQKSDDDASLLQVASRSTLLSAAATRMGEMAANNESVQCVFGQHNGVSGKASMWVEPLQGLSTVTLDDLKFTDVYSGQQSTDIGIDGTVDIGYGGLIESTAQVRWYQETCLCDVCTMVPYNAPRVRTHATATLKLLSLDVTANVRAKLATERLMEIMAGELNCNTASIQATQFNVNLPDFKLVFGGIAVGLNPLWDALKPHALKIIKKMWNKDGGVREALAKHMFKIINSFISLMPDDGSPCHDPYATENEDATPAGQDTAAPHGHSPHCHTHAHRPHAHVSEKVWNPSKWG